MITQVFIIGYERETTITLNQSSLTSAQKRQLIANLFLLNPPAGKNLTPITMADRLGQISDKDDKTDIRSKGKVFVGDIGHTTTFTQPLRLDTGTEARITFPGYRKMTKECAVIGVRNAKTD
jgi:hypothetical protein